MAERRFWRSEEHTSELQSLMRLSYAVFCLKKTRILVSLVCHIYSILPYFTSCFFIALHYYSHPLIFLYFFVLYSFTLHLLSSVFFYYLSTLLLVSIV